MKKDNRIDLIFIINGEDIAVEANIHEKLRVARDKALIKSNNMGRPMDEWEIHDEDGKTLDPDQKIEDLGLKDGDRLFLNLKVGAGGAE